MKTNILKTSLFLSVLSLMSASCVMNKVTHQPEQQKNTGVEISFGTNIAVRGAVSAANELNDYSVWGWFKGTGTQVEPPTQVFNATTVDGPTGTYQGTQYWIENKIYDFYAFHPASIVAKTPENQATSISCTPEGKFEIKGFDTSIERGANAIDLMTANIKGLQYLPTTPPQPAPAVQLRFRHELTWVEFEIATEKPVTIDYVKLTGIQYKGDLVPSSEVGTASTWSAMVSADANGPFVEPTKTLNEINKKFPLLGGTLLLPPQALTDNCVFEMKWTYQDPSTETRTVTVPLPKAGQTSWERGKKYLYSAIIPPTPADITLNVTVKPWTVKKVDVVL